MEKRYGNNRYLRVISGVSTLLVVSIFIKIGVVNWNVNVLTMTWVVALAMVPILLLWYAFRGHIEHEAKLIQSGWKYGFIGGGIGFVSGFIIIPLIAAIVTGRDPAQGPLLGIFITGPAGFPIGVVIGILIGVWRRSKGKAGEASI